MSIWRSIRLIEEVGMDIRQRLKAIPGSYDDFVDSTARWMDRDAEIRADILKQFEAKPDSSYSDIMDILCRRLGIGKPVEIVEDEPRRRVKAAML